jgi:hypothetical protein
MGALKLHRCEGWIRAQLIRIVLDDPVEHVAPVLGY